MNLSGASNALMSKPALMLPINLTSRYSGWPERADRLFSPGCPRHLGLTEDTLPQY